jgi:hypothetical protein
MKIRDETAETPRETGAWSPKKAETYLEQYVETARGEPARLACVNATARLVVAASAQLQ